MGYLTPLPTKIDLRLAFNMLLLIFGCLQCFRVVESFILIGAMIDFSVTAAFVNEFGLLVLQLF